MALTGDVAVRPPNGGPRSPQRPARAPLLAIDPDLARGLPSDQIARAQAVTTHVARIAPGEWQPAFGGGPGCLGLLIADGIVVRETRVGGTCSAELLGTGDIVRPWQNDDHSPSGAHVTWFVPDGARVALIDDRVSAAFAQWPTIAEELFARVVRRSHVQSVLRATSQVRRLDHRTLLYLWHVGERFGRVTPAGLVTRLPLTHERLATLIGAHRPSFTMALRKLERGGLLVRDDDHIVVLTDAAREIVDGLRRGSSTPPD